LGYGPVSAIRATGGQLESTAADKLLENQYVGATFLAQIVPI
jgi:hypothetical protein